MGGTNGSGPALGALLTEALVEEERRLAALEARLAALRAAPAAAPASDSTQAIWAALAVPAAEPAQVDAEPDDRDDPEDAPAEDAVVDDDHDQRAADDADWAALSGADADAGADTEDPPASATSSVAARAAVDDAYDAAAAAVDDDPRLEAARKLLAESGQGLQQLKACLSRAPVWEDPDDPTAPEASFWSPRAEDEAVERDPPPDDEDDPPPPPPVPARERASGPRPRDVEAARFGLERAFRGDAPVAADHEPAWASALRDDQARALDAVARIEELLVELGKTVAAVLERSAGLPRADERLALQELEERAARVERERDDLRRAVSERSERIARLEALVEQVMTSPGTVTPPPPAPPVHAVLTPRGSRRVVGPADDPPPLVQPVATPRGTRRAPAGPSEALRRSLLASPEASSAASRRALEALRPIAGRAEDDRAQLRAALVQIGARHQQLVEEHAALLERLVKLLEH